MAGIDTLFLLVPNLAEEFTQAMLALEIVREAKVKGIVCLPVFMGDRRRLARTERGVTARDERDASTRSPR